MWHLLQTLLAPSYRPPLVPHTALRLHELTRRADVHLPELVALITQDPLVAAEVVRLAQSSVYGRGAQVRSLREAAVRIGLEGLSNLFLEAALNMRVFRAPGYDAPMEALRRHSCAVAHFAGWVAHHTGRPRELAFAAGLLHDVGTAACIIAVADGVPRGELPAWESVAPAVLRVRAEAGALVARHWGLADEIEVVVTRAFEQPSFEGKRATAALVALAEWLAAEHGHGFLDTAIDCPAWALAALDLRAIAPDEARRFAATLPL